MLKILSPLRKNEILEIMTYIISIIVRNARPRDLGCFEPDRMADVFAFVYPVPDPVIQYAEE